MRKLGVKFPALVDGFDNRVESAYTGWPDRLYLIGKGGRVLYKSKPGPFAGFDRIIWLRPSKTSLPPAGPQHRRVPSAENSVRPDTRQGAVTGSVQLALVTGRLWRRLCHPNRTL